MIHQNLSVWHFINRPFSNRHVRGGYGTTFRRLWTMLVLLLLGIFGLVPDHLLAEGSNPTGSFRDPTASVETRIYVSQNRVRVTLEEFSDDLVWLHGMETNQQGIFPAEKLREFYELHRKFLGDNLEMIRSDGTRLKPTLVDEGPYPFEDELLKTGATEFHLVKRKMSFTYEFPSDTELDTLTIRHNIVDENFLYPAELSIQLFQGSSDLAIKSKLRVDTPLTIAFDWENPVPSQSASEEEIGAWLEAQQERMLGVTEFGSVYCWGYIEPRQLRVELLFPLNVLETMFEIESQASDYVAADELPALTERIKAFFQQGNPVEIDQALVSPQVTKVDYFPANQRDFAIRTEVEKLHYANGRVGITIRYPYRKVPRSIVLQWDKFSRAINTVQAYLYFGDRVVGETFSRQVSDNQIRWENPGDWKEPQAVLPITVKSHQVVPSSRHPLWTLLAIGALSLTIAWLFPARARTRIVLGFTIFLIVEFVIVAVWPTGVTTIRPEAGEAIARQSIENVYHAFEFADEEEIYDQLSVSVAGPQLRELYLQLLSGLTAEEQGGAVSSIEKVEVVGAQLSENSHLSAKDLKPLNDQPADAGFRCQLQWNLQGLVEHWGHSHQRTNQYQAEAWFAAWDGQWKLVQLRVESQQPGLTKPRPRKFTRVDSDSESS